MRRNHIQRHRIISLLALALTAASSAAHAQQGYGYPQQSGPAAPSTIPGRGDSEAWVPMVDPAQVATPKPRKPKPQPSPWGGAAPVKPATPPVASQPPVASKPPVVQGNTGTPPNGPVVVTPGQNTPSQPQAGANDRLTSAYRGLGTNTAAVRAGGTTQSGSLGGTSIQRTTSTVLACTQNANTPRITSIRPANESSLQPGGAFIVEGLCFGDTRGKVVVMLPTQYGRIQANEAQIIDWAGDKILAQLPAGVTKATPGDASVEIASAGGTRGAGKNVAFEPRWEKVKLKSADVSVSSCYVANIYHSCKVQGGESGLVLKGAHERGDPEEHRTYSGTDRYDLRMPAWMRLANCSTSPTVSNEYSARDATINTRLENASVMVDWRFTENSGEYAFLRYDIECAVWVPVGLEAQ
jgi:hypothetical protein